MFKIDKPGIYPDISAADYHNDPCPAPSFSQSLGKILLENSALHAWYAHPRLNPDWQPQDPTKFDLGNIAHKLLLGRGKDIEILPAEFTDWRTDKAKKIRAEALQQGRHAVLGKHSALADRMVAAAREQLALMPPPACNLFGPLSGQGEVCVVWKEGDIWLRQLIDWLSGDGVIFADYKTTDMSVAPHALGRKMQNDNWPLQAAMAERGLTAVDEILERKYFFVAQETWPPYALTVAELTEGHLERGRVQLEYAINTWRACMKRNVFPGYPRAIIVPDYPGWADAEWEDRRMQLDDRKMITEIV
jgi:hypothetical protein